MIKKERKTRSTKVVHAEAKAGVKPIEDKTANMVPQKFFW
jgi:hypothetical protein